MRPLITRTKDSPDEGQNNEDKKGGSQYDFRSFVETTTGKWACEAVEAVEAIVGPQARLRPVVPTEHSLAV